MKNENIIQNQFCLKRLFALIFENILHRLLIFFKNASFDAHMQTTINEIAEN